MTAYPYNAVGDNRTDDTNALQAAIDACAEKHPLGAVIVLPSQPTDANGGVEQRAFRISRSLRLRSNITRLPSGTRSGMYSARGQMDKVQQDSSCPTLYWPHGNTAILCGTNASNVAIIGADRDTSVIDGGGWPWYLAALNKSSQ